MNYKVERTNTENSNFRALEKKLDEELCKIYGELPSNNIVKDLKTIIIYDAEEPIASGCLKFIDDNLIEVKRVFVSSEHRSKGISKIVMKELEKWASESNIDILILQTGIKQKVAINLYKTIGYVTIDNYGPYVNDINSVCMRKTMINDNLDFRFCGKI